MQPERRAVAQSDHDPLRPCRQPPGRKGQEHVQEQRRRQHVEQVADAVQHRLFRPLQRGDGHRETGGEHQWPQPTGGPAPPGDQPAHDIGDDDPRDQEDPQTRQPQLIAGHRQDETCGHDRDAGDHQRPEHPGTGRGRLTRGPCRPRPPHQFSIGQKSAVGTPVNRPVVHPGACRSCGCAPCRRRRGDYRRSAPSLRAQHDRDDRDDGAQDRREPVHPHPVVSDEQQDKEACPAVHRRVEQEGNRHAARRVEVDQGEDEGHREEKGAVCPGDVAGDEQRKVPEHPQQSYDDATQQRRVAPQQERQCVASPSRLLPGARQREDEEEERCGGDRRPAGEPGRVRRRRPEQHVRVRDQRPAGHRSEQRNGVPAHADPPSDQAAEVAPKSLPAADQGGRDDRRQERTERQNR